MDHCVGRRRKRYGFR